MLSIQTKNPVILNLTNLVVQTQTANALLAVGASPIMSNAIEEIEEIIQFSDGVNINIGTLSKEQISLFSHAADLANQKGIPVVLDPVGAGATSLRTDTVHTLLNNHKISVLKGNPQEILALSTHTARTNTIDSHIMGSDALASAILLSNTYDLTVVITGEIDYCIDKTSKKTLTGGHPLMSQVTGMGCIAASLITASLAVNQNPLDGAFKAMRLMNEAGSLASNNAKGAGTFLPCFIDALYHTANA